MSEDSAELEQALTPFKGDATEKLAKALEIVAKRIEAQDLAKVDDGELVQQDPAFLSRLAYIAGLLNLERFLRAKPADWTQKEQQARLALTYVKHTESAGGSGARWGRGTSDDKLMKEIATLRSEMKRLTHAKAKTLLRQKDGA